MYENERILIGVVSFGLEAGCERNSPTVSTFISPFFNWINSKVGMIL
jgi:secreted trypsin-like serine protease